MLNCLVCKDLNVKAAFLGPEALGSRLFSFLPVGLWAHYSKSPTYERVPFRERVRKSNFVRKSNRVSLGTQLTQSAISYCTVIGL